MCASYGLGGGAYNPSDAEDFGLEPLDTREGRAVIDEWMREWNGKANTTRSQKRGVNINPLILPGGGSRRIELGWWWLHVGGSPAKFTAFNSRDDALVKKWSRPFQHRALIPADWYFEGKKRWTLPTGEVFAIAAITAPRLEDDGSETVSYSMVTRPGIGEASTVVSSRGESRMPLVLPTEFHDRWLDPERPGDAELVDQVQAASVELSLAMTTGEPSLLF